MKIFLLLAALASAGTSGISIDEASNVWKSFRACAVRGSGEKIQTCASSFIASSVAHPARIKMIQNLAMKVDFSALQECPENHPVMPARLVAKGVFYCMEIKDLKKSAPGYVLFIKERGTVKIASLKYKY